MYENIVLPVELDGDTVDQKFLDEIVHLLGLEDLSLIHIFVDYTLNEELATIEDLSQLKELGIDLKLDFISVSYTHLDVYKRQSLLINTINIPLCDILCNYSMFYSILV